MTIATTLMRLVAVVVAGFAVAAPSNGQTPYGGHEPVQFFLSDSPRPDQLKLAEQTGRDVAVAKVRIVDGPRYLVGRDASGIRPPLPEDLFWVKLEIVQTISGDLTLGTQLEAWFGKPSMARIAWPAKPEMRRIEYFTISSVAEDGKRRLLPLPMTEDDFGRWSESAR